MKINLAKSAGFCFGVKRAIKIAFETTRTKHTIEMLGDIVHNEEVAKDTREAGIKKVKNLRKGKNKIFLVRAHGIPTKITDKAKMLGYRIIDATCPMVKEIHRKAMDMEKKGYKVIIIGDKYHVEVQGIVGHLKKMPLVIENEKSMSFEKIRKIKKACVVVQSTQNIDKVNQVFNILSKHIKDLKLFNTICNPTIEKQNEIKAMPLDNDIMIIIGSKISANTKRLYQISKSLNKKTYWINSPSELNKAWFKGISSVGITAGASTPDYTTQKIIERIKDLSGPGN